MDSAPKRCLYDTSVSLTLDLLQISFPKSARKSKPNAPLSMNVLRVGLEFQLPTVAAC